MRLTRIIIKLHVLQCAEFGLRGNGVTLASLIFMSLTCDEREDVWFAVLGNSISLSSKISQK